MNQSSKVIAGGRNHAIDLMKFFAAILITNSHMGCLYPGKYSVLSMGGAIGDALFFFCSGYLLMMGKSLDFFNWYKRRVNRIFPSVFAVAIIGILLLGKDPTLKDVIYSGGGWFVRAILLFYALFYFVKSFEPNKMWITYFLVSIIIFVWFVWFWNKDVFILYNGTYLRWPCYFLAMLIGGSVRNHEKKKIVTKEKNLLFWLCVIGVSLMYYYGLQLLWIKISLLKQIQLVLVPGLLIIVYSFYKICSNISVLTVYKNKYVYWPVYFISACCLEIYLTGNWSFWIGERLIGLFPLNILLTFLSIFVLAYLVKVFSNFLSQTFRTENYDWKMIKL